MKLRAVISPCPNDIFIFGGLISGSVVAPGLEFAFEFRDLETMNRDVQAGLWDLAKISYANFAQCRADYRLLRCGGALGRGCGPLLLSNRREGGSAHWDPASPVLVPGLNTTANFLLDFHYRRSGSANAAGRDGAPRAALDKIALPFDALYRRLLGPEPCQGVVIHEMRFTYAADGLHLVRDLGEHWETVTGHPIPLGAVALRKDLEARSPDLGSSVETAIRASLDWSYAHPTEAMDLCRRHSQSMEDSVLRSHIRLYVNDFSRDIGPEGEAAVAFFLEQQGVPL